MHPITRALQAIHDEVAPDASGDVADYIPELAQADPDQFGLAVTSMDGRTYHVGDATAPFTIQSVSKPFVYGLALADHGLDALLAKVGAEPSGNAFNAISLDAVTGRPANPMINAGAIMTTSQVKAGDPAERFDRILATLSAFAGRELEVDEATFVSERQTGDRNRALAYLMRSMGSLEGDVDAVVETYFRQCSVLVTAVDLSVMSATLALGGVNPVTGRQVIGTRQAVEVLLVMATCGMYDFSGEWLVRAGLPAKSGVSGALIATGPAQFGIGLFSPRLDGRGNSIRAVQAVLRLRDAFELNLTRQARQTVPVVASGTPATGVALRSLQGELDFAAAEIVLHDLLELPGSAAAALVLDLRAVTYLRPVAALLLGLAVADLSAAGVAVAVVGHEHDLAGARHFDRIADAVSWCEQAT